MLQIMINKYRPFLFSLIPCRGGPGLYKYRKYFSIIHEDILLQITMRMRLIDCDIPSSCFHQTTAVAVVILHGFQALGKVGIISIFNKSSIKLVRSQILKLYCNIALEIKIDLQITLKKKPCFWSKANWFCFIIFT